MQAYGKAFAAIYNRRWGGFALQAAPRIQSAYQATLLGEHEHSLLDVCCGTGQLALHFLDAGYTVQGLDLSPAMVNLARENTAPYLLGEQARFFVADAARFEVDAQVGLAVSTYDALNHLPDLAALRSCFESVYRALLAGGTFIFDLNTRWGLRRWVGVNVEDTEEMMLVNRGIFDEASGRAYTQISGFVNVGDHLYQRFEETAYNTVFNLSDVQNQLSAAGFSATRFCRLNNLAVDLPDPEQEGRVWIVAHKS